MSSEPELRPDHEMEGQVGAWLTDTDLTAAEAEAGLERLLDDFPVTPQVRPGLLGRLLDRDEGAGRPDDHPPRQRAPRQRLVVSATALTAVLLLVLAVGVMDLEERARVQPGTTHVVAADGTAEFDTIGAAVDAAADDDVISILPGTYVESIVVDRDLSLIGDGPREEIVIRVPQGEVGVTSWSDETTRPYGLLLTGPSVVVSDITVEVPVGATGIAATSGSPLIERVSIVGLPHPEADFHDGHHAMGFFGQTSPTVRESEWDGYTAVRHASALFEGNTIMRDGISIDGHGDSIVRDNTFIEQGWLNTTGATATVEGNEFIGGGASFDVASVVEVRGNTFRDVLGNGDQRDDTAIILDGRGTRAIVAANTVSNTNNGIELRYGAGADITGNTLETSLVGIDLGWTEGVSVDGNSLTGEGAGIVLVASADANIVGNSIDVGGRGIAIGSGAAPTVAGNQVCGADESIYLAEGAEPELRDNEIC